VDIELILDAAEIVALGLSPMRWFKPAVFAGSQSS
jgi:hypothetical protein